MHFRFATDENTLFSWPRSLGSFSGEKKLKANEISVKFAPFS
jgi:hypothetical protein